MSHGQFVIFSIEEYWENNSITEMDAIRITQNQAFAWQFWYVILVEHEGEQHKSSIEIKRKKTYEHHTTARSSYSEEK